MKKIFTAVLLALCLALTLAAAETPSVEGYWVCTEFRSADGTAVSISSLGYAMDVSFVSNGTYILRTIGSGENKKTSGTWEQDGDTLTVSGNFAASLEDGHVVLASLSSGSSLVFERSAYENTRDAWYLGHWEALEFRTGSSVRTLASMNSAWETDILPNGTYTAIATMSSGQSSTASGTWEETADGIIMDDINPITQEGDALLMTMDDGTVVVFVRSETPEAAAVPDEPEDTAVPDEPEDAAAPETDRDEDSLVGYWVCTRVRNANGTFPIDSIGVSANLSFVANGSFMLRGKTGDQDLKSSGLWRVENGELTMEGTFTAKLEDGSVALTNQSGSMTLFFERGEYETVGSADSAWILGHWEAVEFRTGASALSLASMGAVWEMDLLPNGTYTTVATLSGAAPATGSGTWEETADGISMDGINPITREGDALLSAMEDGTVVVFVRPETSDQPEGSAEPAEPDSPAEPAEPERSADPADVAGHWEAEQGVIDGVTWDMAVLGITFELDIEAGGTYTMKAAAGGEEILNTSGVWRMNGGLPVLSGNFTTGMEDGKIIITTEEGGVFILVRKDAEAPAPAEEGSPVGTWNLTQLETAAGTVDPADFGLYATLRIDADGTVSFVYGSVAGGDPETFSGTWTRDGDVLTMGSNIGVLADGKIRFEKDDAVLVFERGEEQTEPSGTAAPAEEPASAAGAWNVVYGEQNGVVTMTSDISDKVDLILLDNGTSMLLGRQNGVLSGVASEWSETDGAIFIDSLPAEVKDGRLILDMGEDNTLVCEPIPADTRSAAGEWKIIALIGNGQFMVADELGLESTMTLSPDGTAMLYGGSSGTDDAASIWVQTGDRVNIGNVDAFLADGMLFVMPTAGVVIYERVETGN